MANPNRKPSSYYFGWQRRKTNLLKNKINETKICHQELKDLN